MLQKAHADQHVAQCIVLQHHGIDILNADRANLHPVEFHMGRQGLTIGCRNRIFEIEAVDAVTEPARHRLVDRHHGGTGIDKPVE